MKINMRLYKTYDADLIGLYVNGFPLTDVMVKALDSYVHGRPFHVYVPEIRPCHLEGRKIVTHLVFMVNDPESVYFLTHELKYRSRAAVFKLLVRSSLVYPPMGAYLKGEAQIAKANTAVRGMNLRPYGDVLTVPYGDRAVSSVRHKAAPVRKAPGKERTDASAPKAQDKGRMKRFGDVADLAVLAEDMQDRDPKSTVLSEHRTIAEAERKQAKQKKEEKEETSKEPEGRRQDIPSPLPEPEASGEGLFDTEFGSFSMPDEPDDLSDVTDDADRFDDGPDVSEGMPSESDGGQTDSRKSGSGGTDTGSGNTDFNVLDAFEQL